MRWIRMYVTGAIAIAWLAMACGGGSGQCDVMYETERQSLEALGSAICEWKARCGSLDPSAVNACVKAYADGACDADCDTGKPEIPCGTVNDCIANIQDLSCVEGPVTNACKFAGP